MKTTADRQRPEYSPPGARHGPTRRISSTTFPLVMTHSWLVMIFFGGLLSETVIIYPNVFHDVPRSLEVTMAFAVATRPSDYFAPLGVVCELTGVGSLLLGWRLKSMRYWLLGSILILLVGEAFFSMVFFWSRNRVMFVEGPALHSVAELRRMAHEFQLGHWFRVALSAAAATLSFIGVLKCYRDRISSPEA